VRSRIVLETTVRLPTSQIAAIVLKTVRIQRLLLSEDGEHDYEQFKTWNQEYMNSKKIENIYSDYCKEQKRRCI
jgi:hypothetical protein